MVLRIYIIIFTVLFSGLCIGQNAEVRMLKSMNQAEMPCWDKTMKGMSWSVYGVMPATPLGVWCQGYATKDNVMMRNGYKSAISICLALGLSTGLKYTVNRSRPYADYPDDIKRRDFNNGPYSFPSGHTTSAFASATALSLSYKKWYVAVPAYAYAGLVGYSRMRLGVHYPSDVLGGMVIGIGAGFLTWGLDKAINGK